MATDQIILLLVALAAATFVYGYFRALSAARASAVPFHSRPVYHGAFLMVAAVLPALLLVVFWSAAAPSVIREAVVSDMPAEVQELSAAEISLVMTTVGHLASGMMNLNAEEYRSLLAGEVEAPALFMQKGMILGAGVEYYMIEAADRFNEYRAGSQLALTVAVVAVALLGIAFGLRRMRARVRARNAVERVMLLGLMAASTVAILTTVGIVFSMLFETLNFFQSVAPRDFFFGTVWDPRFSAPGRVGGSEGQFGLLPLLWGTLYISLVALLVAVPIGLYSAIYMSEYASNRVRSVVKPVLEVLAGIPTIVYGFFALVTFGPLLRDAGAMANLQISASSVLTAGIVMGVMIIPFISSLSDDIISAVPQSLREGSYGLGATQSETIKQVVLPAALPGVVGAVLLAASRAIGETMIVVLAAGIAANITLNPGEAVTTITVKIVSQLTGDLEFNSPQTLVAFALGLTLFFITLCLNVFALYIVRKYREQYE
ncbi:MAG: phosphate ABC transporter permease subunit PstC [Alphaproteobacteria bacterium]|nr:phosphate ABC transporter permease subunit PstC [Alphaproteobacteria bacterium]MDX5416149.1 phosphate ABC transporter permease subunit PstC [Alphaproteobacteria bacterium]MDX5493455.1 phosphate ABC transporter permease subunit PstC [Alphaproteobacteria bacterium]